MGPVRLIDHLPARPDADSLYAGFLAWTGEQGLTLYPHQDEAVLEIVTGAHTIVTTPTGSGKSLIATAAHFAALARDEVSFYTAPIKALVSEKFFALCDLFGAENVGMITGDASVNPTAPIICCTAEILANQALREGRDADVSTVIMDEFHYYADRDRGWAWQVPLLELPHAQFVLMSATLGDVRPIADDLERRTERPAAVISNALRPVPLLYSWSMTPIHETLAELVSTHQAPVYVVHSTQAAAVEQAQALLSANLVGRADRDAIGDALGHFRFSPGFGKTFAKMIKAGIGVHHAGLLPRYRRLVEVLAQQGLLKIICGTDTLGVGINVPIRTVLFTSLTKFDGRRVRLMRAREFHQVAGRAGRAGFDTLGTVVAQAPEHVIENERALAKVGDDPKKRRSVRRKKPPEGFVTWTVEQYARLQEAQPEPLQSRMKINHAMILNMLQRRGDAVANVYRLIMTSHEDEAGKRRLVRRALAIARSLLRTGVVEKLRQPDADGRTYRVTIDLQDGFALNQPLSPFALAALDLLDPDAPTFALDVVSVVEATLENPMTVLLAQQFKARGEAVAELKAEGYDYEERLALLDDVSWPQPLADLLEHALRMYAQSHPWVADARLSPKSVVRDMFERAMTFTEFIAFYGLGRSEGVLLRYLSDCYRALRQTVPDSLKDEPTHEIIEWLGETIRHTDSSLVDEWERLVNPEDDPDVIAHTSEQARPVTENLRAFTVMVRNALWRRVELAARDDYAALGALEAETCALADPALPVLMNAEAWEDALGAYWDEHDEMLLDADARGPALLVLDRTAARRWLVHQIIHDPAGNHDWSIEAAVDLDLCDDIGELIVHTLAFARQD